MRHVIDLAAGHIAAQMPHDVQIGFPFRGSLILDPWRSPEGAACSTPSAYGFRKVADGPTTAWQLDVDGTTYFINDGCRIWSAPETPTRGWQMYARGDDDLRLWEIIMWDDGKGYVQCYAGSED